MVPALAAVQAPVPPRALLRARRCARRTPSSIDRSDPAMRAHQAALARRQTPGRARAVRQQAANGVRGTYPLRLSMKRFLTDRSERYGKTNQRAAGGPRELGGAEATISAASSSSVCR